MHFTRWLIAACKRLAAGLCLFIEKKEKITGVSPTSLRLGHMAGIICCQPVANRYFIGVKVLAYTILVAVRTILF
jgi:hypothetical protein